MRIKCNVPRLRVAVIAPPWIAVPPPGYGGIEAVIELLCDGLVDRGHDVTLFAAPGSRSSAAVEELLDDVYPEMIGSAMHESDHVASAWDRIEQSAARGRPFDIVHDHSGYTALAFADRLAIPFVHTMHGILADEMARFYRRHGHRAHLIAISRSQAASAPPGVRISGVVSNPIAVGRWPFRAQKDDYLLWIGRMDPIKGAHRAIDAARIAGWPLVLAGVIQPGQETYFAREVEPHIDGERVRYIGEVTGSAKQELFAAAAALLMPISWREPFGMVMVEALAAGTPVIAFPQGAASEIVVNGRNGYLVSDEREMAASVARLGAIDPAQCRADVAARFDVTIAAAGYERAYLTAIDAFQMAARAARRSRASLGAWPLQGPVGAVASHGSRAQWVTSTRGLAARPSAAQSPT